VLKQGSKHQKGVSQLYTRIHTKSFITGKSI